MNFGALFLVILANLISIENGFCERLTPRQFKQRHGDRFRAGSICSTGYRPLPPAISLIKCSYGPDRTFIQAKIDMWDAPHFLRFENIKGHKLNELFGEYHFFYDPSDGNYSLINIDSGIHATIMRTNDAPPLMPGTKVVPTESHRPFIITPYKVLKKKKVR